MDVAHCYLNGNPDAVEFCPHDEFQHVLAVSTYTLQDDSQQSRYGSISLFNVDPEKGIFDMFHYVDTSGVFDIKWNPVGENSEPVLAQADAEGCMRLHNLKKTNGEKDLGGFLEENNVIKLSSSMCFCLDWNLSATSISVGLSDGSISIVSLEESQLIKQQEWKAHDFEVWATCFDTHQTKLVYTGSDDCKFSCWDIRENPTNSIFENTKAHNMGVCCIVKSCNDTNTVFTGCYDECLRVWDLRSISKPVNETSIRLGGGVWRIKQHPISSDVVLAACMHSGFAVVNIKGENVEVMETYTKHESLAYGADWSRKVLCNTGRRKNLPVATCSFYDRLVRVWIPETDIYT